MEEKGKFRIVHEFSGEEIIKGTKDIYRDVTTEAKKIIKSGKNCRVSILDKNGAIKLQVNLVVGAVGLAILSFSLPILTLIAALGVLLAEHTMRIEEAVTEEEPKSETKSE